MLATITCKTREDSNYVYDLLVSHIRGSGSLIGSKRCVDSFEQVDDVMVFDLTEKEVEDLRKLPQVLNVTTNDVQEISFYNITKKSITGYPKLATYNPPNNQLLSHSLLYCQEYGLKYVQDNNAGKKETTLSTIDCSNVDIVIVDSGIDGTHPDLTDDNNNPLLNQFNWSLLTEPDSKDNKKTVKIINTLPPHYYSTGDRNGHGTACASLAAGKRCGFARNARLYALKIGTTDDSLPGNGYSTPSTSSNSITTGSKTFTILSGLPFFSKDFPITINAMGVDQNNNPKVIGSMEGTVTSYSGTSLVVNITSVNGSGTYASWNVVMGNSKAQIIAGSSIALKLAVAFLQAKKKNLHGLSSSRPTIFSNSWGTGGLTPVNNKDPNAKNITSDNHYSYAKCVGNGDTDESIPHIYGDCIQQQTTFNDSLTRQILTEGGHFLKAAGNSNSFYDLSFPKLSWHVFTNQGKPYAIVNSGQTFTQNQNYSGYVYRGTTTTYMYSSPDIGIDSNTNKPYDKNTFPIIIVGDIIPIGDSGEPIANYSKANSNGSSASVYKALTDLQKKTEDKRILLSDKQRYKSRKGPFFVKSFYSAFGPSIDIYAPGNSAWAAKTSTPSADPNDAPTYTAPNNGVYVFFNGTSSATPIVSGILGTYLSQYPNSTPKEAREWLINNAVKGNIMETTRTDLNVKFGKETHKIPHGSDHTKVLNTQFKIDYYLNVPNVPQRLINLYNKLNMDEVLFACRFFNTPNLIAQAFPLRKAVLAFEDNTVTVAKTTLTRDKSTTEAITHTP